MRTAPRMVRGMVAQVSGATTSRIRASPRSTFAFASIGSIRMSVSSVMKSSTDAIIHTGPSFLSVSGLLTLRLGRLGDALEDLPGQMLVRVDGQIAERDDPDQFFVLVEDDQAPN